MGNLPAFLAGVLCQACSVVLAVLGCYSLFRVIVLDWRGALPAREGTSYTLTSATTLGVATALLLVGRALVAAAK